MVMISDAGLAALRAAATLNHVLPELRTRIRHGDRTVAEVRVAPPREAGAGLAGAGELPRVLSPCEFRAAVGRAHRRSRAGQPMGLAGMAGPGDPAVDIGVPPGGAARPGPIYRVPAADHHCWAFTVAVEPEVAHPLGRDLVDAALPLTDVVAMGLRRDRLTEVTLAFAWSKAQPGSAAEGRLVDLLEALLARWAVHELLDARAETSPDRRPR